MHPRQARRHHRRQGVEGSLSSRDVLDTVVAAETPEGILLELSPAGLSARFYAFALDWVIRLAILYAVAIVAALMAGLGAALMLILLFVLEWFYPVIFELTLSGATPGKRVVRAQGGDGQRAADHAGRVDYAESAAHRRLSSFPLRLCHRQHADRRDCKRLGDIAAATMVVHEARAVPRITLNTIVPVVPVRPLTPENEAAIVALAARANRMTAERLDELAALAASVSGDAGRSGPDVTRRVLGVAQWVLGQR